MRAFAFAAAAVAGCLIAAPCFAQPASPVGQWRCQSTFTQYDMQGNRQGGFGRQFEIAIHPNGVYQAAGQEQGVSGVSQFRSQGQWQMQGATFGAWGSAEDSSGNPSNFILQAQMTADGRMSASERPTNPNTGQPMTMYIAQCERAG